MRNFFDPVDLEIPPALQPGEAYLVVYCRINRTKAPETTVVYPVGIFTSWREADAAMRAHLADLPEDVRDLPPSAARFGIWNIMPDVRFNGLDSCMLDADAFAPTVRK